MIYLPLCKKKRAEGEGRRGGKKKGKGKLLTANDKNYK